MKKILKPILYSAFVLGSLASTAIISNKAGRNEGRDEMKEAITEYFTEAEERYSRVTDIWDNEPGKEREYWALAETAGYNGDEMIRNWRENGRLAGQMVAQFQSIHEGELERNLNK